MKMPEFFKRKPTPQSSPEITIFSGGDENDKSIKLDVRVANRSTQRGSEDPTQQNEEVTLVPAYETGEKSSQAIESNPPEPLTAEQIIEDFKEAVLAGEPKFDGVATERFLQRREALAKLAEAKAIGNQSLIKKYEHEVNLFQDWLNELKKYGFIPAKFDTSFELKSVLEEIERLKKLPGPTSRQQSTLLLLAKLHKEKVLELTNKLRDNPDFREGSLEEKILAFKAEMRAAEAAGQADVLEALALEVEILYQQLFTQKQKPPTLKEVSPDELSLVEKV